MTNNNNDNNDNNNNNNNNDNNNNNWFIINWLSMRILISSVAMQVRRS